MPRRAACLFVFLLAAGLAPAADPDPKKAPPALSAMSYRNVGPFAGGRVCRACGVPGDPLTYYAATAGGGIWKSADGGLSWKSVFDDQPCSSVGSIAVAASDANVVYAGTGEANIRGNVAPGAGVFKSTDAGKTWKHVWKQVGQIGTMAIHPKNADVAFAAVLGHAFGPNPERGVYRTTDGGTTWKRVLFQSPDAGCSDVAIDPTNPRVVFAGFWEARRRPWDLTSGGPGSGLFVSRDGGDTWKSLKTAEGLPKGVWGKVGVAVSPANGQRVFALVENEKGGLFRSDDGGDTWQLTSDSRTLRQRAWYYQTITPHPTNPDIVYCPNVPLLKSSDGGKTFAPVRGIHHGDHHDVWFDPANPNRMINANDGSVDISSDGGRSWTAPLLPISQFYHVHADNRTPYHIMGNMQDLGTAAGPSNSLKRGITPGDWYGVGGGETGSSVPDPADPNIVYSGEYGGILTRYDHRTKQVRNVSVNQVNPSGIDPAKHKYRFQWTTPVLVSVHDRAVYHGGNVVFRTRDGGQTWDAISPDLTRNDKQKQQWSGGPITGDNTGAETYCTVFALAESPKKKGRIWAGSDDGLVHVTDDDGKTWQNLTSNIPDLPDWGTVACIEPGTFDADTAYVVVDNHRSDDYRPHAWKTTDLGKTWVKITAGLDGGTHLHAVREDPKQKGLLYLATDRGVLFSPDAGTTWKPLQLNLPTAQVHDIIVKNDDLVLATHGRSLWILDDLTPVRHAAAAGDKPLHVYPAAAVTRWRVESGGGANRSGGASAKNPPGGAVVWFHLGKKPKTATITITDDKKVVIAKFTGKPDAKDDEPDEDDDAPPKREFGYKPGANKFEWDLTHDGAEIIPGAKVDSGGPGAGVPAAPGTYTLTLDADGKTETATVVLKPDPRLDAKLPYAEQTAFALKVRDEITALSRAVLRLRGLQKQLKLRAELLKDDPAAKELLAAGKELAKTLDAVEGKLHNPKAKVVYDIFAARGGAMLYSQLVWLLSNSTDGDGPPTKAMAEFSAELTKTLAGHLAEFDAVLKGDVAKLNAAAKAAGVPELYIPKAK